MDEISPNVACGSAVRDVAGSVDCVVVEEVAAAVEEAASAVSV